jgi:hypothetical protein
VIVLVGWLDAAGQPTNPGERPGQLEISAAGLVEVKARAAIMAEPGADEWPIGHSPGSGMVAARKRRRPVLVVNSATGRDLG